MRDTKTELLVKGHELAVTHGLGHLTSKVMADATGFYNFAVLHHFTSVAAFREAVRAYGIRQGSWGDDVAIRSPRVAPAERKVQIFDEAYRQAGEKGLGAVNGASVSKVLGVSYGLIGRYFGSTSGLREAVLAQGIVQRNADIVADAIELQMSIQHVPPDLVTQAKQILAA